MSSERKQATHGIPLFSSFNVSYQTAIKIYSLMILIVFSIYTVGFGFNLRYLMIKSEESETLELYSLGESIALFLSSYIGENFSYSDLPEGKIKELQEKLSRFRVDIRDRIYLVLPKKTFLLSPQRLHPPGIKELSGGSVFWKDGWLGKQCITAPYAAADGKRTKAFVQPVPPGSREPAYLIVLERDLKFSETMRRMSSFLLGFIIIGFLGMVSLIYLYGVTMIRPFRALESVVNRFEKNQHDISVGRDPLSRAIVLFESTLKAVREKETELNEVNALLDKQVRRSREFQEDVLSTVNSGIITFDQYRKPISITSKAASLLHLHYEKLTTMTCEELFGSNSLLSTMLTDGLKHRRIYSNRQWKWHLPGVPVQWLSVSTHLLKGEMDSVIGVGFVIRDITERKQLEELIRAKEDMAALGEMAAGIAHEIRNPLAVIRGNTDLLADDLSSEEIQEVVSEIKAETDNLDRIIRDFLKFARPVKLDIADCDIGAILKEIVSQYRIEYEPRIRFGIQLDVQNTIAQIDEGLFRQIILNLLDNAV
ncbi:hypothetical protein JW979_09520, partial [bacterium]|nr:hypothetical protein [candidate division CSSED10-310 bacterium]